MENEVGLMEGAEEDKKIVDEEKIENIQEKSGEKTKEVEQLEDDIEKAKISLAEAEKEVEVRYDKLKSLQKSLEFAKIEARKIAEEQKQVEEADSNENQLKSDSLRKKWRVLGMKVRIGVTTSVVRQRRINDPSSFSEKEFESRRCSLC